MLNNVSSLFSYSHQKSITLLSAHYEIITQILRIDNFINLKTIFTHSHSGFPLKFQKRIYREIHKIKQIYRETIKKTINFKRYKHILNKVKYVINCL